MRKERVNAMTNPTHEGSWKNKNEHYQKQFNCVYDEDKLEVFISPANYAQRGLILKIFNLVNKMSVCIKKEDAIEIAQAILFHYGCNENELFELQSENARLIAFLRKCYLLDVFRPFSRLRDEGLKILESIGY